MITKERIDELLKQRAKIWGVGKQGNVFCVGLKFRPDTLKNKKWLENKYEVYSKFFETKEEAEWHKEFGCIERTERLELPTWEEFRVIGSFEFYDYKHNLINLMICLDPVNIAPCNDCIYIADKKKEYFCKPKTKENYTLACRKCKELFLGNSKNI